MIRQQCTICGAHLATRVTTDEQGNPCWHCGYCARWHPASIQAYLHGKRLFANEKSQPQEQVAVGSAPEEQTPRTSLLIPCDCPEHGDDCNTWLELTADGFLILEDKDGMRVSMLLPAWLEAVMYQALVAHQ
ncbi:MAG: hypothetical protein U0350_48785 [Caldilineaceae bacterium]